MQAHPGSGASTSPAQASSLSHHSSVLHPSHHGQPGTTQAAAGTPLRNTEPHLWLLHPQAPELCECDWALPEAVPGERVDGPLPAHPLLVRLLLRAWAPRCVGHQRRMSMDTVLLLPLLWDPGGGGGRGGFGGFGAKERSKKLFEML